jgi:hypothetical protein
MPLGGLIPYGPTQKKKKNAGAFGLSAMLGAQTPQTQSVSGGDDPANGTPPPATPPPASPSTPPDNPTNAPPAAAPPAAAPAAPFSDVQMGVNPHAGNIDALRRLGMMAGVGGGQFNPGGLMTREHLTPTLSGALGAPFALNIPSGPITRGDFALLLNHLLGPSLGQGAAGGAGFSDVSGAQGEAANRLNRLNITAGVGGGRFDPSGLLTREMFASLLANALRVKGNTANL